MKVFSGVLAERVLLRLSGLLVCVFSSTAQADLPDIVQAIRPSVVAVGTWQNTRTPRFVFMGTGFVVGDGSLIATNAHVKSAQPLNTDQMEMLVIIVPGRDGGREAAPREVLRVASDELHDLALLKLKSGLPLSALPLNDVPVREGQSVGLLGYPLGGALGLYPAVQQGIVATVSPIAIPAPSASRLDSSVVRRIADGAYSIYQLDIVARPGNSGSPVFDVSSGKIFGVVSFGMVRQVREGGLSGPTGITYAIPVEHLQRLIREQP